MTSPFQRIVRFLVMVSPFVYPAYLLHFKVAGVPFTGLEVFVYVLFGLWLLELVRDRKNVAWDPVVRNFWVAAFLIFVGATVGVAFSPISIPLPDGTTLAARQVSLGVWKGWVLAPILYFAVLTQMLKTSEDVWKILKIFVFSAALVGIVSHLFALFGNGLTYDFRLNGFFESANQLALYIVPAIPISVVFLLHRHKPLQTWDYLNSSALAILVYTLLFTQSYAGILAVFVSVGMMVAFLMFRKRALRKPMLFALAALVLAFVGIAATQVQSEKFRQFLDFQNRSSTSVRLQIYQVAARLVDEHPLVGIGPGLFQANYQRESTEILGHPPYEWDMPHPHNIFLAFWLNAGLLGLAAFVGLLFFAHRRFTFPLVALWAIVLHGLFDTPFWKNDLAMIFWLVIAAIVVLQRDVKRT
jgi:O-antigen ligase